MTPGQSVDIDRLPISKEGTVELDKVLLVADGDKVTVGTPTVAGAKVVATWQSEAKGEKVIGLKYKSKIRYRRRVGHRQIHTTLMIDNIVLPGGEKAEAEVTPAKRTRRRKTEVKEDGA